MSEKRKDSKGRILKTGESERKDGLYQFRYKDVGGERRTIYEKTLQDLRKREKEIELMLSQGVSCFDGSVKLCDAMDKLFLIKRNWKDSTRAMMGRYRTMFDGRKIYSMSLGKIKTIDCKEFCIELHNEGYAFGTIATAYTLLKMTFEMAKESDAIIKNPCSFQLKSIIDDDTPEVAALTKEQEQSLLNYLKNDTIGKRHYDMFVILLGTGIRISEFAAITLNDVDFSNNTIRINKQLVRLKGGIRVAQPKSKSGFREIPMTPAVRRSAHNLVFERQKIRSDVMIDGYVGFLSVTRNGRPRTHSEYADAVRLLMNRYNEREELKIERCTPHVLRHTFCTKCISEGMDVKTVQYLMGHSDASTTLNIYADTVMENVVTNMEKLRIYG